MLSIETFIIVSVVKTVIALFVLLTAVAYSVWLERKVIGHIEPLGAHTSRAIWFAATAGGRDQISV